MDEAALIGADEATGNLVLDAKWANTICNRVTYEVNTLTLALVSRINELGGRHAPQRHQRPHRPAPQTVVYPLLFGVVPTYGVLLLIAFFAGSEAAARAGQHAHGPPDPLLPAAAPLPAPAGPGARPLCPRPP